MFNLDLNLIENGERFQSLCYRIADKEYKNSIPIAVGSWDKGLDILQFNHPKNKNIVWQCKFTKANSLSPLKPKIQTSLKSLNSSQKINKWILCDEK